MPELWYRKLGFYSNPFSIKPAAFHNEIIGHNTKVIYDSIKDGKAILLEGDYGIGKTTLLKQIINRFKGHRKLIYYNASIAEGKLNVPDLLEGSLTFADKITGKRATGIILLIDEAQFMPKDSYDELLSHYESGDIKSIVLVGFGFNETIIPPQFKKLLAGNRIKLGTLRPNQAVQLVRKRIGNLNVISDSMIKRIYAVSENPRLLLENCEDIIRYVAEENGGEVRLENLKRLLMPILKQKGVAL